MDTPFKPETQLENPLEDFDPEVKSFIYQAILEFEPFTTPETVISVFSRDPLELLSQDDEDESENATAHFDHGELPHPRLLKKMHRVVIAISEGGSVLESEGLHKDIYEAIRLAKQHLLQTLTELQDDVISNQDRTLQIRHAMAAGGSIH